MILFKISRKNIIFSFFYLSILLDLISGFSIYYGFISISIIAKLPFLFIVIYDLIKSDDTILKTYIVIFICYISCSIYYNFITSGSPSVLSDLQQAIKPLFIISFIYWIRRNAKANFGINLRRLSFYLSTVIILNQIVGLFGYGYSSYAEGIGITGFFYSGNEYSFIMLAVVSLQLFIVKHYKPYYYYPVFILLFVIAVTTAIKTAILGTLIIGFLIKIKFNFNKILWFVVASFIIAQSLYITFYNYLQQIPAFSRLEWVYENKGIVDLFFSGRIDILNDALVVFTDKLNIIEQLLGTGYYRWHTFTAHPEMDMFDIIFMYGLLGFIIIYLPFVFQFGYRACKGILAISVKKRFVSFMSILFFSISFVAGHVIFSVALSPFLAIILNIDKLLYIEDTVNM